MEDEKFIADDSLKKILTIDMVRRRDRNWPLIPESDWELFECEKLSERDDCRNHTFYRRNSHCQKHDCPEKNHGFKEDFPFAQELLDIHYGHLALCGGFMFKAFDTTSTSKDLDFFFHSCTPEYASEILKSSLSYLTEEYKNYEKDNYNISIRIERRKHITNFRATYISEEYAYICFTRTYQFIHRVYPNLGSVLGGFDIGPSMVGYDGKEYWATELGAWSIANSSLVLDISRRSTTFSTRIRKYYKRGFTVILPGVPENIKKLRMSFDEKIEKLQQCMRELKLCYAPSEENYNQIYHQTDFNIDFEELFIHHDYFIIDNMYFGSGRSEIHNKRKVLGKPYKAFRTESYTPKEQSDYGDQNLTPDIIAYVNKYALDSWNLDMITVIISDSELRQLTSTTFSDAYDNFIRNPEILLVETSNHAQLLQECKEDMSEIKWITQNVGRQWTSSINPEIKSASEYYGEVHEPFFIGIPPEVELLLRLMWKKPGNPWNIVNRDAFNCILKFTALHWW